MKLTGRHHGFLIKPLFPAAHADDLNIAPVILVAADADAESPIEPGNADSVETK